MRLLSAHLPRFLLALGVLALTACGGDSASTDTASTAAPA